MTTLHETRQAARKALASETGKHDFYGGPPLPKARLEISLSLRLPPAMIKRDKTRHEQEADRDADEAGATAKAGRRYIMDTTARAAFEVCERRRIACRGVPSLRLLVYS